MSDYFTQFSCIFDVGSAENASRAHLIREDLAEQLEENENASIGFDMDHDCDPKTGALWIYSDDGNGDPEHVISFVKLCAEAFNLQGRWGFVWGLTCSKPRLDGFGGGAQLIDLGRRESLEWMDCRHWLAARTAPDAADSMPGVLDASAGRGGPS